MPDNLFPEFSIFLSIELFTRCFSHFLVFISSVYICATFVTETAEVGGMPPPHFLLQIQFLTAFLDHRVTKSYKVTRTATKSQEIARSKFQFSQSQSAQTLLDGLHLRLSIIPPPHSKLLFEVPALWVEYHLIFGNYNVAEFYGKS